MWVYSRCVLCVAVVGRWGGSYNCVWVVVVLCVEVRVLPGWLHSTALSFLGSSWRVHIATEGLEQIGDILRLLPLLGWQ